MADLLQALKAADGSGYCHLFENVRTGLSRGVFWSFRFELGSLEASGQDWPTSIEIEWMRWGIRSWRELERCSLDNLMSPSDTECSIYFLGLHQPATPESLAFRHLGGARFLMTLAADLDVEDLAGKRLPRTRRVFEAPMEFDGASVMPGNVAVPKGAPQEATKALGVFLDTRAFEAPVWDGASYRFAPRVEGAGG